jgi:hypothetical protein
MSTPAPKRHHQADRALARADRQPDDGVDQERGAADEPPEPGFEHRVAP